MCAPWSAGWGMEGGEALAPGTWARVPHHGVPARSLHCPHHPWRFGGGGKKGWLSLGVLPPHPGSRLLSKTPLQLPVQAFRALEALRLGWILSFSSPPSPQPWTAEPSWSHLRGEDRGLGSKEPLVSSPQAPGERAGSSPAMGTLLLQAGPGHCQEQGADRRGL